MLAITTSINTCSAKVVVFGAVNVDLLATADHVALTDDSTPGTLRRSAGGVGRNIAENLVRLGIGTTLVSAIGDDEFGGQILDDLRQLEMDVSAVAVNRELATASYTAIHNCDGELLYAVNDMRIFDQFELPLPDGFTAALKFADAIVLEANLPESVLQSVVDRCQTQMIVADAVSSPKCQRLAGILSSLSLLKVNRAEARVLSGCDSKDDKALLHELHGLGPKQILLTTGSDGVVLSDGTELHSMPAMPDVNVVSTSGAGDAMLSAVLAARLQGYDATEQLNWGTVAAAETLGVHSACAATLSLQLLSSSENLSNEMHNENKV